eukprot:s11_g60.t2
MGAERQGSGKAARALSDPLVNEFYDELQKHWRLKATAPVVVIDLEDEDENEVDLTEFFELIKAEGEVSDGEGVAGVEAAVAYPLEEDPYMAHLEFQTEEASKPDAEAPVVDSCQVSANVKEASGEVVVEELPPTSPKANCPATPEGPVVKVPFTPTPKMSHKEIVERIALLKFLACEQANDPAAALNTVKPTGSGSEISGSLGQGAGGPDAEVPQKAGDKKVEPSGAEKKTEGIFDDEDVDEKSQEQVEKGMEGEMFQVEVGKDEPLGEQEQIGETKDENEEGAMKDDQDQVVTIDESDEPEPPAKKMKTNPETEHKDSESEEPPLVRRVDQWEQKPKPKAKGKAKAKAAAKCKAKAKAKATAKCKAKSKAKAAANEPVQIVASGDEGDVPTGGCPAEQAQPKKRARKQTRQKAQDGVNQPSGTDEPPKEPPIKYQPVDQQGKADLSAAYQWKGKDVEADDGSPEGGEGEGGEDKAGGANLSPELAQEPPNPKVAWWEWIQDIFQEKELMTLKKCGKDFDLDGYIGKIRDVIGEQVHPFLSENGLSAEDEDLPCVKCVYLGRGECECHP